MGGMLCCSGSLLRNGASRSSRSLDAEKFKLELLQKSRCPPSFNHSLCLIRRGAGTGAGQEGLERPRYLRPRTAFCFK